VARRQDGGVFGEALLVVHPTVLRGGGGVL